MRRKHLTRKGKALRWLLAVVVLGVLAWALLPWNFTAEEAHRQDLKRYTTGAEVVYKEKTDLGQTMLLSLNDHVIGMGLYRKNYLLHWNDSRARVIEREADRPFAAGQISEYIYDSDPEKRKDFYYVFGVIQDESLAAIQIDFDATVGGYDQSVRLTEADWLTAETGERFFVCPLEPEVGNRSRACAVTGYRTDGSATDVLQLMGAVPFWEDQKEDVL